MTHSAPILEVRGLGKSYAAQVAAADVSLSVEAGQTLALLGPSGSGKSTVLRMVAGLETPTVGEVWLRGHHATHWPPEARQLGLVFQDYALFPHLRVLDNVAYGLRRRGMGRVQARHTALQTLAGVGLQGLEGRYPHQLSGGQQQRVALARALATQPDLLLLDEPLSNLDEQLRLQLRTELRGLFARLGAATLLVTHDHREALSLSSHLAVMRGGVVAQRGKTTEVFARPTSAWVAAFFGYQNLLPAAQGQVLLVPEQAVRLGQGEACPVLAQQPSDDGVQVQVQHPLGRLSLHLSAREALPLGNTLELDVDRSHCLLLPDDR